MASIVQDTRCELAAHELVVLTDAANHELRCADGELWITVDGDARDIILGRGQTFRIESSVPIVVSALKPSTLYLRHAQAGTPRAQRLLATLLKAKFPLPAAFPSPLPPWGSQP